MIVWYQRERYIYKSLTINHVYNRVYQYQSLSISIPNWIDDTDASRELLLLITRTSLLKWLLEGKFKIRVARYCSYLAWLMSVIPATIMWEVCSSQHHEAQFRFLTAVWFTTSQQYSSYRGLWGVLNLFRIIPRGINFMEKFYDS